MSDKRKNRAGRDTLRNYFRAGSLPEARHFHDLIDSTLNMEDEGFSKTPQDGFQIFTKGGESSLLSFFREGRDLREPLWRIRFDTGFDSLQFVHVQTETRPDEDEGEDAGTDPPEAVLSLAPGGRVGINTSRPAVDLDVRGIVRARGRSGVVPRGVEVAEVLADGRWHDITRTLTGCQALEVVAGVGGVPREGEYALLHATALNAYNPRGWFLNPFGFNFLRRKNRIRVQHAYFRSRRDKLQLRWSGDNVNYRLQIRTRRDYGTDRDGNPIQILFHVTELWHHPTMRASASGTRSPDTDTARLEAPDAPPAALGKGEGA